MTIRNQIKKIIKSIQPYDRQERDDLYFTSEWIDSGVEIFRISKPANPDIHIVAYFLLIDPVSKKILLVDHKKATMWIPAGGHIEVDEHPKETVKREIVEELGIEANFFLEDPFFLTISKTSGTVQIHTDIALWYLLKGGEKLKYLYDQEEFHGIKWFSLDEIPFEKAEPHLKRCISKLKLLKLI